MRNIKLRFLSLFLSVSLVIALFPAITLTAYSGDNSGIIASGQCGDMTWSLDDSGTLTINCSGYMCDFGYASSQWTGYESYVKSVVFNGDIISIGKCAFYRCENLTSITIPDGVKTICEAAFLGCQSLKNIYIPDSVSSIGERAFYGCSNLTSISVPNGVTYIGPYTFAFCEKLKSVSIPNSVRQIYVGAFRNCSSLENITIPEGVSNIDVRAFYNCNNLTQVYIPSSVIRIEGDAFIGCSTNLNVYYSGTREQFENTIIDVPFENNVIFHYNSRHLSITSHPKDYSGLIGSTATFNVGAEGTGLSYQWQYYSGGTWKNFGSNKPSASLTVSNAHNGMQYRCIVKDSFGNTVTSNAATIHITNTALSITTQPKDYSGRIGSTGTFSVTAQGTGLSYQWQYYSGGTWNNFGSNKPSVSLTVSNSHNGMKYRCIVKDSYGKAVTSNVATIHITNPLLSITTQPKNYAGVVGSKATFSVVATGTGLTYQWQYYSGGTWKNFGANDSKVSLTVSNAHNGMKYRCIVKDSSGKTVTSNVATIKIITTQTLSIITQPKNYTGSAGSRATFSVTAQGTGLSYQWQYYSGGKWNNFGSNKSTVSLTVSKSHNGMKYRCIVKDSSGKTVTSNAATIKVV